MQQAGAWSGSIVRTNDEEVGLLISDQRWDKAKSIINKWFGLLFVHETPDLNTKEFFSD